MDIFEEIDSNLIQSENSSDFENNKNNNENNNEKELLENQIKVKFKKTGNEKQKA